VPILRHGGVGIEEPPRRQLTDDILGSKRRYGNFHKVSHSGMWDVSGTYADAVTVR
jgi:hypothetical protein